MWKHNTNILLYTSAKLHLHDKAEIFHFLENLIIKKNYKLTLTAAKWDLHIQTTWHTLALTQLTNFYNLYFLMEVE